MAQVPVIQIATEAQDIGNILIAKYHNHLASAKILYLFTDQTRKKCDRVKLGSAAKMNALQRFLASTMESVEEGPDFYLLFDAIAWATLDEKQTRALVDHELTHCCVNIKSGDGWRRLLENENKDDYSEWRYGLRGHDVEEFASIIQKYGFWKTDKPEQDFMEATRQIPLPGMAIMVQSRN